MPLPPTLMPRPPSLMPCPPRSLILALPARHDSRHTVSFLTFPNLLTASTHHLTLTACFRSPHLSAGWHDPALSDLPSSRPFSMRGLHSPHTDPPPVATAAGSRWSNPRPGSKLSAAGRRSARRSIRGDPTTPITLTTFPALSALPQTPLPRHHLHFLLPISTSPATVQTTPVAIPIHHTPIKPSHTLVKDPAATPAKHVAAIATTLVANASPPPISPSNRIVLEGIPSDDDEDQSDDDNDDDDLDQTVHDDDEQDQDEHEFVVETEISDCDFMHLIEGKLLVEGRLGRGAQGSVFVGVFVAGAQQGHRVAIKAMPKNLPLAIRRDKDRVPIEFALARRCQGVRCPSWLLALTTNRDVFYLMRLVDLRCLQPHVYRMHEWFETDAAVYIIMELVRGVTLDEFMDFYGYNEMTIKFLMYQYFHLLNALESHGVVHRDIKPANLMLDMSASEDMPTLVAIDFGLAKDMSATSPVSPRPMTVDSDSGTRADVKESVPTTIAASSAVTISGVPSLPVVMPNLPVSSAATPIVCTLVHLTPVALPVLPVPMTSQTRVKESVPTTIALPSALAAIAVLPLPVDPDALCEAMPCFPKPENPPASFAPSTRLPDAPSSDPCSSSTLVQRSSVEFDANVVSVAAQVDAADNGKEQSAVAESLGVLPLVSGAQASMCNEGSDGLGSLDFMSPEALQPLIRVHGLAPRMDVWAGGILHFMLMIRKHPFPSAAKDMTERKDEIQRKIIEVQYKLKGRQFNRWSPECQELVALLLVRDPAARPSALSALALPFFTRDEQDQQSLKNLLAAAQASRASSFTYQDLHSLQHINSPATSDLCSAQLHDTDLPASLLLTSNPEQPTQASLPATSNAKFKCVAALIREAMRDTAAKPLATTEPNSRFQGRCVVGLPTIAQRLADEYYSTAACLVQEMTTLAAFVEDLGLAAARDRALIEECLDKLLAEGTQAVEFKVTQKRSRQQTSSGGCTASAADVENVAIDCDDLATATNEQVPPSRKRLRSEQLGS
ncbi:kinase-like domain-containing protein [Catenaria anguillulae PL171]|uniref:Kinase-like domain-containing protein n=1 Tax=Catenaria anguillulae PL171 TaxID=765915 RepID=A0A1Y2H5H2_9FUNG|nr:kinase-like domain-containing protein [Catenaria anguillulae PL171]